MTADIIDFLTRQRASSTSMQASNLPLDRVSDDCRPAVPDRVPSSRTGKNERLRRQRKDLWRKADAATCYWSSFRDFTSAKSVAQREGVREAFVHSENTPESQWDLVEKHRDALSKQLLTPAPTLGAVNWKRTRLESSIGFVCSVVTKEQIEKAIADDIAFLDAHPARQPARNKH